MSTQEAAKHPMVSHLSQLVGGTITGICADMATIVDPLETTFGLNITAKDGRKMVAWIQCDREGNGAGFLAIEEVEQVMTIEHHKCEGGDFHTIQGLLEAIRDSSLNPAHTMTKLGLEEALDACHSLAADALTKIAGAQMTATPEDASKIQELADALSGMLSMHNYLCKKINWGSSFLDGAAIKAMNEAPIEARRVLAKIKPEPKAPAA